MYAIDFGTSNTVVSRWNAATQQPETLFFPDLCTQGGPPLIPSLLYVEKAAAEIGAIQAIAGQAVRDRGLDLASDPRFFRNFKRGIGTPVTGFFPELDGQVLSFEKVGSTFLKQVVDAIRQQDPAVDSLVFTVPVDSFEPYRLWLSEVCQTLDIAQVRLLDEPTAAALGYQLTPETRTLLVIDFGGGTLDFSLVQPLIAVNRPVGFLLKWGSQPRAPQSKSQKTVRVLAKAGESLGGADIDRWIGEYFAQQQGLPINPMTLALIEQLKITLSKELSATSVYFDEETLETYELSLDRTSFEQMLKQQGFFQRLDKRFEQVLQQAQREGISLQTIDAVLLIGGSTQIPAVQAWVEGYFPADKIKCDRPFEAVSQGALSLRQTQLQDFLYHSYGIRYWDRRHNTHSWHPIIQRGQPYPSSQPIELVLGASSEKQPSIELIMGEMGENPTATEVYFEGDRLVTRQSSQGNREAGPDKSVVVALNDREGARTIAQLTPPGFPGSDRIRILFNIDRERFLRITVEDLLTNETLMADQAVVRLK